MNANLAFVFRLIILSSLIAACKPAMRQTTETQGTHSTEAVTTVLASAESLSEPSPIVGSWRFTHSSKSAPTQPVNPALNPDAIAGSDFAPVITIDANLALTIQHMADGEIDLRQIKTTQTGKLNKLTSAKFQIELSDSLLTEAPQLKGEFCTIEITSLQTVEQVCKSTPDDKLIYTRLSADEAVALTQYVEKLRLEQERARTEIASLLSGRNFAMISQKSFIFDPKGEVQSIHEMIDKIPDSYEFEVEINGKKEKQTSQVAKRLKFSADGSAVKINDKLEARVSATTTVSGKTRIDIFSQISPNSRSAHTSGVLQKTDTGFSVTATLFTRSVDNKGVEKLQKQATVTAYKLLTEKN